uniref:ML domain-containing protein n=1 Tax=Panagrellus redivivus TaxID=6233 RepID=A0A7E4V1P5_PANRE
MIILAAFAIFGLIAYGSSLDGLTPCNVESDVVNGTICGRTQDYLRIHNPTMLNITYPGQLFQFTITNWNPFFTAEIPLCYKATLNLVAPFETCPQGYIELLLKNITFGTTTTIVATAFPTHRIEYETFVGFPEIPPLMWIDFGMIDTFSFCMNSRKESFDMSINFGK